MFKIMFKNCEVYSTDSFVDACFIASKLAIEEQGELFEVTENDLVLYRKVISKNELYTVN